MIDALHLLFIYYLFILNPLVALGYLFFLL